MSDAERAMSDAQQPVETFWPPPRRQVVRYLLAMAVLLAVPFLGLGVFALTLEAREGPGASNLRAHFGYMTPRVLLALCGSLVLGALLALAQLRWVWRKSRSSLPRLELEPGERLEAFAPAYVDQDATLFATWGEFLAISDRRLVQLRFRPGGRRADQRTLCARDGVEWVEVRDRGRDRHPLAAAALRVLGESRGLRVVHGGGSFLLLSECLSFDLLLAWLRAHGFTVVDEDAAPALRAARD